MSSLTRFTRSASRCSSARSLPTAAVPSRMSASSLATAGTALVARGLEPRDLTRLRLFERRELSFDASGFLLEPRKLRELAGDRIDAHGARAVVVIEIDEHASESGRAFLRQQQLEQLLTPGHVARAHLAREGGLLGREAAIRLLGLLRQVAASGLLDFEIAAQLGERARRRRDLDFGSA